MNDPYLDFLNSIKNEDNKIIIESISSGFLSLLESKSYELKSKGGKTITTSIPPNKRNLNNIPKYANGKDRIKFQDWLEMEDLTHSTGRGCDGRWYGWSHRAIFGFKIGDKIKKGDIAYNGKEYTIKTDKQAKDAAFRFAESVS